MHTRTFHFEFDAKVELDNGETEMLTGLRVAIEAEREAEARSHLLEIATEMIHDEGGNLTSAPLRRILYTRNVRLA